MEGRSPNARMQEQASSSRFEGPQSGGGHSADLHGPYGSAILLAVPASAADSIEGQVLGAGAPIAKSTVTLWSASADAPKQLAQTQSGDDGRFHAQRRRIA